jgi:hypothetical protein
LNRDVEERRGGSKVSALEVEDAWRRGIGGVYVVSRSCMSLASLDPGTISRFISQGLTGGTRQGVYEYDGDPGLPLT